MDYHASNGDFKAPNKIIMRQLIICSLLISLLYSCKEKTSYQLRILIKNETETSLKLSLFPKAEYLNGSLYYFSENGNGFRHTDFEIAPDLEQDLYTTSDLKILPNELVEKVFNSIQISPANGNEIELKFSPETVVGYTENLYKVTSDWIYELRNFDLQTQLSSHPVESHDYIFVISQDNYLKK